MRYFVGRVGGGIDPAAGGDLALRLADARIDGGQIPEELVGVRVWSFEHMWLPDEVDGGFGEVVQDADQFSIGFVLTLEGDQVGGLFIKRNFGVR